MLAESSEPLSDGGLAALEWNRAHGLPDGTLTVWSHSGHAVATRVSITEEQARFLKPSFDTHHEVRLRIPCELLVPGELDVYQETDSGRYLRLGPISPERAVELVHHIMKG